VLRNRDPSHPAAAEVHSRNLALVGATECQRGRPSDSAAYLDLPSLRWPPRESSDDETSDRDSRYGSRKGCGVGRSHA